MMTLLALAAFAQAQPAPSVAGSGLASIPGVTIRTYDVRGKTIREILQSLTAAAPMNQSTGRPVPATSGWSIKVGTQVTRTGSKCAITAVTTNFTGEATLPHLVPDPATPPAVLANWNSYLAQLDARHAEQLRYAYDHRAEVEQAVRASSCDNWQPAANAAIDRLRQQASAARSTDPAAQPQLRDVVVTPPKK
ncbi:DUF922 domain-containing Zn-dependent protease [Sphingomonas sp. BN140010]|uniref:DUF922 domain-containing Zn-dependent protease n=1 Tax=Sphingomonas arvum TaxID=2992113 RepID=A0ABT3JDR9_9SPHN|nr:DUF922 domain-containing Zn-dependent protease [Sphingomonas sp. BN140010]MCW3796961.1 DUF922 domain-containing Zn-dependent protease [Sphingomonas sp. BN140010]